MAPQHDLQASNTVGDMSPRSMSAAMPATRLVQLAVPKNAREGDRIQVHTECGSFEVPLTSKASTLRPGKQINVDIPVPPDFGTTKKLVVDRCKVYHCRDLFPSLSTASFSPGVCRGSICAMARK